MQNYLLINTETNTCDNLVVWDGDASTWQPSASHLAMVADTTPAMVWVLDETTPDYILSEVTGAGAIGFDWNGSVLTTDQPKPAV